MEPFFNVRTSKNDNSLATPRSLNEQMIPRDDNQKQQRRKKIFEDDLKIRDFTYSTPERLNRARSEGQFFSQDELNQMSAQQLNRDSQNKRTKRLMDSPILNLSPLQNCNQQRVEGYLANADQFQLAQQESLEEEKNHANMMPQKHR